MRIALFVSNSILIFQSNGTNVFGDKERRQDRDEKVNDLRSG